MASNNTEITIPVADPNDPYAVPAAMPSSADREPRSFDVNDFAAPERKQDDWRYTPLDRIGEFFDVFKPSGETIIAIGYADGTAVDEKHVAVSQYALAKESPARSPSPAKWAAAVVEIRAYRNGDRAVGEIAQPVLVNVIGSGDDLDALHLVISTADEAHADVVVEHHGLARLAEGVEIVTGKNSHVSTTFVQEWEKTTSTSATSASTSARSIPRHSVVTLGGDVVRIRMIKTSAASRATSTCSASTSSTPASTSNTARWWCTTIPSASPCGLQGRARR